MCELHTLTTTTKAMAATVNIEKFHIRCDVNSYNNKKKPTDGGTYECKPPASLSFTTQNPLKNPTYPKSPL